MKRKLSLYASILSLCTSFALLAIMVTDVVPIVVNAMKDGGNILALLKNVSLILQVVIALLSFIEFFLSASLIKALKYIDGERKVSKIITTFVFNIIIITIFIVFVILNHPLLNIIEVAIVGFVDLIANIFFLIGLSPDRKKTKKHKKPVKKRKSSEKRKPVEKQVSSRYTFRDKAQDLLLLIDLRDSKAITQEEYERLKEEILREKIVN